MKNDLRDPNFFHDETGLLLALILTLLFFALIYREVDRLSP